MEESQKNQRIQEVRSALQNQNHSLQKLPWYAWRERDKIRATIANLQIQLSNLENVGETLGET